jgi:hypothetical protein
MTSKGGGEALLSGSFLDALFYEEPSRAFSQGYVFKSSPKLTEARKDPDNGYWRCDIADHERLTWSEKVYELFGLPVGSPIQREWVVEHYAEQSKVALKHVRDFGLRRNFGFILDAEIKADKDRNHWIRVLAVPILRDGRVVALHGLKRAI